MLVSGFMKTLLHTFLFRTSIIKTTLIKTTIFKTATFKTATFKKKRLSPFKHGLMICLTLISSHLWAMEFGQDALQPPSGDDLKSNAKNQSQEKATDTAKENAKFDFDKPYSDVSKMGPIILDDLIPYKKRAKVDAEIKRSCGIPTRLADHIRESVKDLGYNPIAKHYKKDYPKAPKLKIKIAAIHAPKGSGLSGRKRIELEGELIKRHKVVASFSAMRSSNGGLFGAYGTHCGILGKSIKSLAKDIRFWLEKPVMDARLGEWNR